LATYFIQQLNAEFGLSIVCPNKGNA